MPDSARQRGHASRTVWIDIGSLSCISKPVSERGDGRIAADSTRAVAGASNINYTEQIWSPLFSTAHGVLPGSAPFEPRAGKISTRMRRAA